MTNPIIIINPIKSELTETALNIVTNTIHMLENEKTYSKEEYEEVCKLLHRHMFIHTILSDSDNIIKQYAINHLDIYNLGCNKAKTIYIKLLEKLRLEDHNYIHLYMTPFINSSILSWKHFKGLVPTRLHIDFSTHKFTTLSDKDNNLVTSLIAKAMPNDDYAFSCNDLPTDAFYPLIPSWFGSKISIIQFAALCGNQLAFNSYFINNSDSVEKILIEHQKMDYAALYGGNIMIINTLENIGIKLRHAEACIISHNNNILAYGIKHWNFSIDSDFYINTAIKSCNIQALLMFKINKNFIDSDTSLLCAAVLKLLYQNHKEFCIDAKYDLILNNNPYKKQIKIIESKGFSIEFLKKLFSRYINENNNYKDVNFEDIPKYHIKPHPMIENYISDLFNKL